MTRRIFSVSFFFRFVTRPHLKEEGITKTVPIRRVSYRNSVPINTTEGLVNEFLAVIKAGIRS